MKRIYGLYGDVHHDDDVVKRCLRLAFGEDIILTDNPADIPWDDMENQVALYVSMKESNTTPLPDGTLDKWITPEREQALYQFVVNGGSALFVHNGLVGFAPDSVYHKLTGGVFVTHPMIQHVQYSPLKVEHPLLDGVVPFVGEDEHYFCRIMLDQVDLFLGSSSQSNGSALAGWTQQIGKGRTASITPGHTQNVVSQPSLIRLLQNAADWLMGEESPWA